MSDNEEQDPMCLVPVMMGFVELYDDDFNYMQARYFQSLLDVGADTEQSLDKNCVLAKIFNNASGSVIH